MSKLLDLKQQRTELLNQAEAFVSAAERQSRVLTPSEQVTFDNTMSRVKMIDTQLEGIDSRNTLKSQPFAHLLGSPSVGARLDKPQPKSLTADYVSDFFSHLMSGGQKVSAALYEGSNAAGGYAVPSVVDNQIVPLASAEMALRRLATVLPTSMDVKIPIKATKGTAAAKAEGDGTGTNVFGGTAPTLTQKTLGAHMAGDIVDVSWEALQDITFFQAFATDDLINAVLEWEEPKFISGSGTGEPEGVLTGADTTTAVAGVTLDGIYDLVAALKGAYHVNAAFLMQRATGLVIRKLQRQANLFEPVWTRENGQDYLLGYPVGFSDSMPASTAGTGAKPIVFGSFKSGYVIGDRGGSGIFVKVLDQPKAKEGITQLLAYRRTDGRVRRSEALKAYVLA